MIFEDSTRRIEFSLGGTVLLLGLWMGTQDYATTGAMRQALYTWPWQLVHTALLVSVGVGQVLAVGTRWPGLRLWTALLGAGLLSYMGVVYTATAEWSVATPLLWLAVADQVWVAFRIYHDKAVNGADRRGREINAHSG